MKIISETPTKLVLYKSAWIATTIAVFFATLSILALVLFELLMMIVFAMIGVAFYIIGTSRTILVDKRNNTLSVKARYGGGEYSLKKAKSLIVEIEILPQSIGRKRPQPSHNLNLVLEEEGKTVKKPLTALDRHITAYCKTEPMGKKAQTLQKLAQYTRLPVIEIRKYPHETKKTTLYPLKHTQK